MYNHCLLKKLFGEWSRLLQSLGVEPVSGENSFAQIVAAYSCASRHYHNLEHINHVLDTILLFQSQTQDLGLVELAAWFHDVIYDTQAQDNEEKSAEYAAEVLQLLAIPPWVISTVTRLILHTKNHQAEPDDFEAQVLLDADLAILGTNEFHYRHYAQAIRQEYAWLSDEKFICGRKRVLQKFLQRQRIYYTDFMFAGFELSARHNLQAELNLIETI